MPPPIPCLWFDGAAEAAVAHYTTVFDESATGPVRQYDEAAAAVSGQPEGSTLTVDFELEGQRFVALNGGPQFPFTPAISFGVRCATTDHVEWLWERLIDGGTPLMPLDTYPFSERYGWLNDRFGVSWQLSHAPGPVDQRIVPSLLFAGDRVGESEAALHHYADAFDAGRIESIEHYGPDDAVNEEGSVLYGECVLDGYHLTAMDSGLEHEFDFNESVSFVVECPDQAAIDRYWDALTADGGEPGQCGWLTDRFGVSWQVVPMELDELLYGSDEDGARRVSEALLDMDKLDIAELEAAYDGA